MARIASSLVWKEEYANSALNAEIAASGAEDFATDAPTQGNRRKYGSMNSLLVTNRSSNAIRISLDGNIFAEIFANSSISIAPEDGRYFDFVRITNLSAADVCAANTINVRWSRNIVVGAN